MAKKILTKQFSNADFKQLVVDNLVACNSIELVILKGHVLIEYILNHLIDKLSNSDADFDTTRFSFSQKSYVAELITQSFKKDLIEEINLVNKLRNDIAHTLSYNEKHLGTLLSRVGKKHAKIIELRKNNEMSLATVGAITFICGTLYGQCESQMSKKKLFDEFLKYGAERKSS